MAEDVADITVAVEAAGADMAEGQLEGLEEQLNETAQSASEQADAMGDISERWQGTMSALVTGLAVASAGLLSQVPVIGEAFAGLASVVDAVAFQMDQVLRPLLQPLTDELFGLSGTIFELDGVMGDLVGGVFSAVAALGALAGVALAAEVALSAVAGTAVFGGLAKLGSALAGLVAGSTAALVAVGALAGGLGVLVLEVTGVLDAVRGFGQYVANALPASIRDGLLTVTSLFTAPLAVIGSAITGFIQGTLQGGLEQGVETAVSNARQVLGTFVGAWKRTVSRVGAFVGNLVTGIRSGVGDVADSVARIASQIVRAFKDLINDAATWAKDMIDEFVKGLKQASSRLADGVKKHVAQTIRDHLPGSPAKVGPLSDLDQTGPGLVDTFAGGIEASVGTVESAGDALGQAADPSGIPAQSSTNLSVFLSGRQAESATAQYRDDAVLNRGRPQ